MPCSKPPPASPAGPAHSLGRHSSCSMPPVCGIGTAVAPAFGNQRERRGDDHHRQGQQGAHGAAVAPSQGCGSGAAGTDGSPIRRWVRSQWASYRGPTRAHTRLRRARHEQPRFRPARHKEPRHGRATRAVPAWRKPNSGDAEPMAFSGPQSEAAADAPGVLSVAEAGRAGRRAGPGQGVAACPAPFVRFPHAGSRSRSAQPADVAGSCRYLDGANIYPCANRAAAAGG